MDADEAWEKLKAELEEERARDRRMWSEEGDREGQDRRAAVRLVLGWVLVLVAAGVVAGWAVTRVMR